MGSNRSLRSNSFVEPGQILIGIMHVTKDPWLSITLNGQMPSWEKSTYKNFSVMYFFGKANRLTSFVDLVIESLRWEKGRYASYGISYFLMFVLRPWRGTLPNSRLAAESESKIPAQSLKVNIPELTSSMRWKKLAFLKHFLENTQAEYVLISTSSSIINLDPIVDYVSGIEDKEQPIYAGRLCKAYDCDFTSGAFTLMNRASARLLLENRKLIPVHVMDDVAFGTAFKKLGAYPTNLMSLDFDSIDKLDSYSKEELAKVGHFRFKSGPLSSRGDVKIMKSLIGKLHSRR